MQAQRVVPTGRLFNYAHYLGLGFCCGDRSRLGEDDGLLIQVLFYGFCGY